MATTSALNRMLWSKEQDGGTAEYVRIYRVPNYMKDISPSEFKPRAVFVGLHTHTKLENNDPMNTDSSKLAIALIICGGPTFSTFTSSPSSSPSTSLSRGSISRWKDLLCKLDKDLKESREMYNFLKIGNTEEQRADVDDLLALDASFIVAFLRYGYSFADCWGYPFCKVLNTPPFLAQKFPVLRDLVLLENQVPMSLLRGVISYFRKERNCPNSPEAPSAEEELYDLLAWFVVHVYPFNHGLSLDVGTDPLQRYFEGKHKNGMGAFQSLDHLLECAYIGICGPENNDLDIDAKSEHPSNCPLPCTNIAYELPFSSQRESQLSGQNNYRLPSTYRLPSATNLRRFGVSVKVKENSLTMNSIRFVTKRHHRYRLLVPKLIMNDNTASVLRNLALYEQIRDDGFHHTRGDMRTYLYLMSSLIDNVNDVYLLINNGVIVNQLGSAELVCKQWNAMCDGLYIPPSPADYWSDVQRHISQLEKSKSIPWFVEIEEKHFSSILLILSFVFLFIVFACTLAQTGFACLSYFRIEP